MRKVLYMLMAVLLLGSVVYAQTGKISGRVTDAETGEPLPGVNVILQGTEMGAATDSDGYYNIISVPPGTYIIQASFIGYATYTVEGLLVNIDLTTTQNFALQPEAIAGQEVVVEATAPIVQPDISANIANVQAEEIESVPVAGVSEFINLQAGVEPGMSIRGGSLDEVAFMVDGLNTAGGRDNEAFTNVSYTSIDQLQVQTGGFNAEYGNVRSGLINVATREGPRDRYTADLMVRYSSPQKKYFGMQPDNPNSYWLRSFTDEEVWDVGSQTSQSPWDFYEQTSYAPNEGFNNTIVSYNEEIKANTPAGQIPDTITASEAQQVFLWRARKGFTPEYPEYQVDGSFGGPIPYVSQSLGELRFFTSYRYTQTPYQVPQNRELYYDQFGQLKLTSNISSNMKLMMEGVFEHQYGINTSSFGSTGRPYDGSNSAYPWQGGGEMSSFGGSAMPIFVFNAWNPSDLNRNILGLKFTHTISQNTVYEAQLQRTFVDYFVRPAEERNYVAVDTIGGYPINEAPKGWTPGMVFDESKAPNGETALHFDPFHPMRIGGHHGGARDSTEVTRWNVRFDLTSQMNRWSQLKTGFQLIYNDYNTLHGQWEYVFIANPGTRYIWDRSVLQGAFYIQDKLEFQGMIANIGLRADYFKPIQDFYVFEDYPRAFSQLYSPEEMDDLLDKEAVPIQLFFSPRVGISFPMTTNSKLFFNYGHFRQMLSAQSLIGQRVAYRTLIDRIGNPEHPMPRTVSYELGFEQSLMNQWLLRMTGYYKSLDDQPLGVSYTSIDNLVRYQISRPYNYEDIRGFEISLNKNSGRWIRGFLNYTYLVTKSGNFGYNQQYENDFEQMRYEQDYTANYQETPIPEPFARFNITFLTPPDYGPSMGSFNPFGDWRLNLLGEYRSGQVFTWAGSTTSSIIGLTNNVKWRDFYMLDLRFAKNFALGNNTRAQIYVDIDNVFNLKYLYRSSAFAGDNDEDMYMNSLHLPSDTFSELDDDPYSFIYGDDRPGDYRPAGVDYQPVEVYSQFTESLMQNGPNEDRMRAWYYTKQTSELEGGPTFDAKSYYRYVDSSWEKVPQNEVDTMLDNKAYINMPNNTSFRFQNPRMVYFGFRIWF